MNIDALLGAAIIEGSLAGGMLFFGYGEPRPGWRAWAASCALRSASLLLYFISLTGLEATARSAVLMFTVAMIFTSVAISMHATALFLAARPLRAVDLVPWLAFFCAHLVAWVAFGDLRWLSASVSLGAAYGFGWCCARTLFPRGELVRERRFLAAALALWSGLFVARAGVVLVLPRTAGFDAVAGAALQPWFVIGYIVASVGTVIGLLGLRNRQLLAQLDEARRDAVRRADVDALTGLLSRTAALAQANAMFAESVTRATPLWVLMIDCDHFKRINDRFGHLVGDTALRALGEVIRKTISEPCVAGRFGGEEFIVVMVGNRAESPRTIAETLREAVHSIVMDSGRRAAGLTVSIGVSARDDADRRLVDVVQRADEALLHAKATGRDRVVVARAGETSSLGDTREMAYRHSDFSAP